MRLSNVVQPPITIINPQYNPPPPPPVPPPPPPPLPVPPVSFDQRYIASAPTPPVVSPGVSLNGDEVKTVKAYATTKNR